MAILQERSRGLIIIALAAVVTVAAWLAVAQARADGPQYVELPAIPAASAETQLGRFNPQALYEQRAAGVVTIASYLPGGQQHREVTGSGFVVDAQGYVLTNSHVVQERGVRADYIYIDFMSGDRVPAAVVGLDLVSDIAVLRVDPEAVELQPLPLGDGDAVAVGEPVAAIGAPFGNRGTLTTGIVSAVNRSFPAVVSAGDIPGAIQTDAAINKGNSGGPLFNTRGEVIGINTQIRSDSGTNEGIAFALPINVAQRSLEQILAHGTVRYAWLGLDTETVTPQMAHELELGSSRGVLVTQVVPGGPSAAAGLSAAGKTMVVQGRELRAADQLVSLAGQPVYSTEDVGRIVHRLDPGVPVEAEIYRGSQRQTVRITPQQRGT